MTSNVLAPPQTIEVLVPMKSPHRRQVERIIMFDFTVIRKTLLMENAVAPDIVDTAIDEFRKFLILARLGYIRPEMPSRVVVKVWQTFIHFTSLYHAFCEELMSYYLHHRPYTPDRPITAEAVQELYRAYELVFGYPPGPLWRDTNLY